MLLAILQLKPLVIKKKLNGESKWWFFSISHEFYTSQITQVYTSQQITMLMNINPTMKNGKLKLLNYFWAEACSKSLLVLTIIVINSTKLREDKFTVMCTVYK